MEMLGSGGAEYGRARRQVVSYAQSVGARGAGRVQGAEERPSGPGYHAGGASVLTTPRGLGESSMQGVVVREDLKHKPSPYQWQAVKARKAPANRVYSVLPHLPTYTRDVNGIKRREEGDIGVVTLVSSSIAGGSSNAASEYAQAEKEHQRRIQDNYRRRDDLLREAARMYNRRGGRKARGASGDIAWYFAERAHEFTEAARREQLNAARAMVLRKQAVSGEQDAIDLHGTTVAEAEAIVLEVLEKRRGAGQLRIVTGRGSHSVGGQSVLKPAVRKRLVAEGYTVRGWEAGLVVVMS
ncbi:hypothetical protein DFP72DRAFT_903315 [Ephemerocybe angulata]|uniref:Smr domain-containing protein n=1 Tax=Ephemerocybe angulata TaxID=980116 RepID=A0A8H6M6F8_9AGAR|nr:hypothetical protein DFP72DRAFT_903315 [Tulosesus angulatus]